MNTVEKKQYYLQVIEILFELKYKNIDTIYLYFPASIIEKDIEELNIESFYFFSLLRRFLEFNNLTSKDIFNFSIKEIFELIIEFLKFINLETFESFNI